MKTFTYLFVFVALFLGATTEIQCQDGSYYLTITQSHWNWDNEDGSPERWLELEKMWHDNVIMKNEHIAAAGVYHHQYTGDNSEVLFVTVYPSWMAIEKAGKRTGELVEQAWPDEEKREELGRERSSYYAAEHSDEIYTTQPYSKPIATLPDEPLTYLIVDRHHAFPEDGDNEEYNKLLMEFHTNVTHKNPHLLGFYAHRHAWGSDARDLQLVFVVKSMDDIDDMQAAQGKLIEEHWPDEEARDAFFASLNKYFTPWHSDKIYQNQPELAKRSSPPTTEAEAVDPKEK